MISRLNRIVIETRHTLISPHVNYTAAIVITKLNYIQILAYVFLPFLHSVLVVG